MSCKSRRRKQLARWHRAHERRRGYKDWPLEEVYRRLKAIGCTCIEQAAPTRLANGRTIRLAPGIGISTCETIGRERDRVAIYTCHGCDAQIFEDRAAHSCTKCGKLVDAGPKCETCRGAHLSLVP